MPARQHPTKARALGRLLRIIRVQGDSMVPALHDGDRLLAVRPWPLRRGAIVVGRVPAVAGGDGSALFIKRVLALPGEIARVPLDRMSAGAGVEQFGATIDGTDATWPVPAGHVFVKGDAYSSADSASWGAIPRGDLVGVVVARMPRRDDQGGAGSS